MNKLDGSMQSARWYKNDIIMSGSRALDENQSWRLKTGKDILKKNKNYIDMMKANKDYTFIFEFINLADAHVVLYDKSQEGLYLIGARNVYTGEEIPYEDLKIIADLWNVKIVERETISFEELLEKSKTIISSEKEGWVIDIDGHKIKIKGDDYVQLHKMLDILSSINVIIQNIAEGTIDDLLSKIPEKYRDRALSTVKIIQDRVNFIYDEIEKWFERLPNTGYHIGTDMIWIDNNVPKEYRGYVKSRYLGKDFNILKKKGEGYKKVSDLGFPKEISEKFSLLYGKEEEN